MSRNRLSSLVAAVAMTAAAGAVPLLAPAPAQAAACSGTGGVTVVVDYNEIGDGISTGCDADGGGKRASEIFPSADFSLRYATASQGFVCQVTGAPSDASCVDSPPATAYWSLWWSDGKSGKWTYATRGVQSLVVPNGGYIAFAWHEGAGRASAPDVAPTPRVSTPPPPKPSSKPSKPSKPTKPSSKPSQQSTPQPSASATPTEAPTASESPTDAPTASESNAPSATASPTVDPADPTATVDPDAPAIDEITAGPPADGVADSGKSDDGGLPVWLPIGAVVVVAAIGGGVAWRRRHA